MNDRENQIKTALNQISVPHSQLDSILEQVFQGEQKRKVKWPLRMVKYTAAIALVIILTFSSALVSPTFANIVLQIPLIGSVFNYFASDKAYYSAYEELSTDVGLVEASNGVEIIIDRAIYDGNLVTLSFVVKTSDDFGYLPKFDRLPQVHGKNIGTSYEIEYVKDVGYVGIMTLSMFEEKSDTVNILWEPKLITFENRTIKGDWTFQFSLKEILGTHIAINQKVSKDGVTVHLIDAEKTDVNLSINYSQIVDPNLLESMEYVEAELYAIDNLGNKYKVPYNGGTGIVGSNSSEDFMWNATIHGLDKKATSITFYPFATISNIPSASNETNSNRIDFEPITISLE